jgi:ubiquinol-cytochrome c reductase cytochrome b subunit
VLPKKKISFDLLPFYAILRSISSKVIGVIAMFAAILILLALPFLETSSNRGFQYKPVMKFTFWIFVANFLCLMRLGGLHAEEPYIALSGICTVFYFSWFLIIVPAITLIETSLTSQPSKVA